MFKIRHPIPGEPPGALRLRQESPKTASAIRLIDYDQTHLEERVISEPSELLGHLDNKRVTWINIDEADQSEPVLRMGSSGLPVRRLQSRMSAVGFDIGGVDGRFGAKTEQGVKQLQQQAELGADGVVGAKTWAIVDALENEGPAT